MLHSQDHIHSSSTSVVALTAAYITTLLPCDEDTFECGEKPASRAALQDTPPAKKDPRLVTDKNRSVFASLMQVHYLWGLITRGTEDAEKLDPFSPESHYYKTQKRLDDWEAKLPRAHTWSKSNLRIFKLKTQDLVCLLSCTAY